MNPDDRDFSEAVTLAVRDAERGTVAEIVVVVAARSGSYLDVALIGAALGAGLTLAGALFAPMTFHPAWVMLDVPLVFGALAWVLNRAPALLVHLVPEARAKAQVERAAASQFVSQSVHGVKGRTGLLIYVSRLERCCALIADLGLESRIHPAVWSTVRFADSGDAHRVASEADLLRGIGAIGALLRERAPGLRDDADEIPDAPRIFS